MSIYNAISEDLKNNDMRSMATTTIGIVTDINDPNKLGRVKVKLTNRTNSNYETDYIRVVTPMSGAEWGMAFLPEVGDEVLVAFCDGDICKPYVIGSLWNKEKKMPVNINEGKNDIREIKTRCGHSIIFDDSKGKEKITITTSKELKLSFEDKNSVITVSDKDGSNELIIDGKKGTVSIKAKKKIELMAGSSKLVLDGQGKSVKIESDKKLQVKGNQVNIEGKGTAELKSSGQLTVQASGITNVKGSIVKIN